MQVQILKKQIIHENSYLTISTCDSKNSPWISPLFYAVNDQYNFYWVSPKKSKHSENIGENPNISWMIFDSTAPKWTGIGVYFTGKCCEISDTNEILKGLTLIFHKLEEPIPSSTEYSGGNIYRVYKATTSAVSMTHDITKNGKTIDARIEISLTPPRSLGR